MRYCPNCRRISEKWPDRCRFCGRTWNVRICRRGHLNPANTVFCMECGSADLSETAKGGRFINFVLRRFQGRGLRPFIKLVAALTLPFFALGVVTDNLAALLPFLVAIGILLGFPGFVGVLKLGTGLLPSWLTGGMRSYFKDHVREYRDRAKGRDSRGK